MKDLLAYFRIFILLPIFILITIDLKSQCQLNDGNGNPSANPIFTGCSQVTSANDTDFVLVVNPSNNFGNWTMDWGDGTSSGGASLNPPAFITHTYISVTGGGTVFADTFFFTFTSGACVITGTVVSGYPVTANIEVPGGLTQLTCAPGTLRFINNSNGASGLPIMPGTVFTWDWGDGSPLEVYGYDSGGDTIPHTYQRNTVNCVTEVDLTANNPCNLAPSLNSQSPVLIYDLDDAAIAASATVLCYPDTVVNFANGSMFNCFAQGNTDQRYEYWDFGNLYGTGNIIVNWRPSGPPLGTPAPNPIPIAFPGIGVYTINMIDSNMCGQEPATIDIEIVPPPIADISSVDTVCAGENVLFQNLSTGGANAFAWNFDQGAGFEITAGGNQNRTYNTPGNYVIRLAVSIAGSNCIDTAEWSLTVLPSPTADIAFNNQSGCDSLDVVFTDASTGSPLEWLWDFDNGNTSTLQNPPSEFYGFPANFNVSLTVTNAFGCDDTDNQIINVFQTPEPRFSLGSLCVNELAQFMDSSTFATGDPIVSWIWNFGDGSPNSTVQNPFHTYLLPNTYDVILFVATANCSAQDTIQVVAEELPVSAFTMDTTFGCSPLNITFANTSSLNSASFFWDFGDGDTSTLTNPNHIFTNSFGVDTNYQINLIASTAFGCKDTSTQSALIFPNPVAAFNDSAQAINCTPAIVGFQNLSGNGAVTYLWDFGNGNTSTALNPRDTFINNSNILDTSIVTLIAYSLNGCSDTTTESFLIFPKPSGIADTSDSGCVPLTVQFPAVTNAVSYQWIFGDGSFPSNTPGPLSHTYTLPGDFTVRLVTGSAVGCKDTSFSLVRVHPLPGAQFTTNVFQACAPAEVIFTNLSTGASNFHWDYDDGITLDTTGTTNTHTFENTTDIDKEYIVKLEAENIFGCVSFDSMPITVYPQIFASFDHDTVGCSPFGVLFLNTSNNPATNFGWHFGDGTGSSQRNPAHPYINNGTVPQSYTVSLIASSPQGCRDSVASDLVVYPQPNANFTVDPPTNTLTYPDTVFTINNLDIKWRTIWDFGDGTSSTDSIPGNKAYTGWGVWRIKLVAYNEFCEDSSFEDVTILPPLPLANFGDSLEGCEDLTVEFINKSKYAHSFRWEFINAKTGSKQSSIDVDPEVTFTDPGTYNIILQATGDGGVDEKTKFGYITVYEQPIADFTFAPEEVFVPSEPVVFNNNSRGDNLRYSWDFGDGSTSTAENPEHYYQAEGDYLVTLNITNGFCEDEIKALSPVTALSSGSLKTPNAFTPKTDGDPGVDGGFDFSGSGLNIFDNDIFYPKITGEIKNYEFMIFNKWGEMLFRTTKSTVGWTGWYRKTLCQQDVYVYKVNATMIDNSNIVLVGDLTLLR